MITRLDKVTVYVNDQEEAKKFWIGRMGFVLAFEQEMAPGMKWIEVAPKGDKLTTLVLYSKKAMQAQNPAMVSHPSLMFNASDIEGTHRVMKAKAIEVTDIQNLPYGRMFNFKDNDGNLYMVRD